MRASAERRMHGVGGAKQFQRGADADTVVLGSIEGAPSMKRLPPRGIT